VHAVTKLVPSAFGTHWPPAHVQQAAHQGYFPSFPLQYDSDALPPENTAPGQPRGHVIPFMDSGSAEQYTFAAPLLYWPAVHAMHRFGVCAMSQTVPATQPPAWSVAVAVGPRSQLLPPLLLLRTVPVRMVNTLSPKSCVTPPQQLLRVAHSAFAS